MLAVELRRILRPEFNKGAHIFVGHCSTRIEIRRVDGLELLAHPAHTDTQRQPATRENVDGRENLRGQHGRSMRHHHDGGHETQARRFRGDPGDLCQLLLPLAASARCRGTPLLDGRRDDGQIVGCVHVEEQRRHTLDPMGHACRLCCAQVALEAARAEAGFDDAGRAATARISRFLQPVAKSLKQLNWEGLQHAS